MPNVDPGVPPQNQGVAAPLQGLFLDRPPHTIDPRGFSACNNVRIEFGAVHSDLMGWIASSISQLPGPCIYGSVFIDSYGAQVLILVTTTDLIVGIADGTNYYITPTTRVGYVSATNGSPTVTGMNTSWAYDISGNFTAQTTGTVAPGSTKLYIQNWNLIGGANYWPAPLGCPIVDQTDAAAINPGTYVQNVAADAGGFYIILSQATIAAIADTDLLYIGNGVPLRTQLRAGDQIYIGSNIYNVIGGDWYTIASIDSNTSLTLTAPYTGANVSHVLYTGRQLLTNTLTSPVPYLAKCDSSNFPAAGGYNNNTSGTVGGDLWLFTNGVDPVVVYSTGDLTRAQYARSIPFVCKSLRQTRGVMIYGGLSIPSEDVQLGTSIASSDNGVPLQLAGGVSFQGIAVDGPFTITRVAVLGSVVMLYCTGRYSGSADNQDDTSGAVVSASFVGFPTIWAFSDVIKTRGPVEGGAITEFPDRHQFLAIDGMYRYNGLFIQVMNDHIWRNVMKGFDTTRPNAVFTLQAVTYGDLIWVTPQVTDPAGQLYANTAYVEAYMEQANSYLFKPYTMRDFPFTAAWAIQYINNKTTFADLTNSFSSYTVPWNAFNAGANVPGFYAGDFNGNIWQLYTSNMQNGSPALATATWATRRIGNGRSRALVKRVYPEIEQILTSSTTIAITGDDGTVITGDDGTVITGDAGTVVTANVTISCALQWGLSGSPVNDTQTAVFDASYTDTDLYFVPIYRRARQVAVTIEDAQGLGWICNGYDLDWVPGGLR